MRVHFEDEVPSEASEFWISEDFESRSEKGDWLLVAEMLISRMGWRKKEDRWTVQMPSPTQHSISATDLHLL